MTEAAAQPDIFSRLSLLVGAPGVETLSHRRVLVCGLGGVGSWAAEALARSAIGHLAILDFDTIRASNLNRQLHALHSTLGLPKTEAMARRLLDINPGLDLEQLDVRLDEKNAATIVASRPWDYVIDAIDERRAKLALLSACLSDGVPVVSSLGSASKLLAGLVTVADISETYGCPLAKVIRKALKRRGYDTGLRVVYSPELPVLAEQSSSPEQPGERRPLGTIAYMPALFGLRCAAEVLDHLLAGQAHPRRGETPRQTSSSPSPQP